MMSLVSSWRPVDNTMEGGGWRATQRIASARHDPVAEPEASLLAELDRIILKREVRTLFQPIFDLRSKRVFGYEALSRGPDASPLRMPDQLFATARKHHRLFALEYICREIAIGQFLQMDAREWLFLNVDPLTLMDPGFRDGTTMKTLQREDLSCSRVVIELTEHTQIGDMEGLKKAVDHYRNIGFAIALDDLSSGYSNLQLMAELRPEYIKLDIYFTRQLADDHVARAFVRTIANLARHLGCAIIAEGIESPEILCEVEKLGLDFAQGYLLGEPSTNPNKHIPENIAVDFPCSANQNTVHTVNISLLLHHAVTCTPEDSSETLLQMFQKDTGLLAVPVVENGRSIGMVRREPLLRRFSIPFGHDLYARKSVHDLMWKDPLIVSADTPIETVSAQVTRRPHEHMYAPVIVESGHDYVGMVFVHDLLEYITQHRIEQAMNANPLTHLPGNIVIEQEVSQRLTMPGTFVLCYIDLDNFKAFNDRYSYNRGDAMLRMLADIIKQTLSHGDFAGHIGGDDFIVILEQRDGWEDALHAIMHAFRNRSRTLYDPADMENGYIISRNRSGEIRKFPLASLSIGAVPCSHERFPSHLEAAEVASELKCKAKKVDGNRLEIDRRMYQSTDSGPDPESARGR